MYPSHMEDRILVSWPQVPSILIDTILSVEDQTFFNHNGISLRSISRAFFTKISATCFGKSLLLFSDEFFFKEVAETKVLLFISSIICAEIFFDDL